MNIQKFGITGAGREVNLYTLRNHWGMQAQIMNMGATLVSLKVPDKEGNSRDIVLGYDCVEDYEKDSNCFGAIIGRNCNRIKGTQITIDGFDYVLDDNDGGNNLHSGFHGINKEIWSAMYATGDEHEISFCFESTEGSQGFPGTVNLCVTYELTEDNKLSIHYEANTNRKTIVNMTNHTYFNLNGHDSGIVDSQKICILADEYTPIDEGKCPTGEIAQVEGTPFDFRKPKRIGKNINDKSEQLRIGGGYDHNYVNKNHGECRTVAKATSLDSGIEMKVRTDRPGLQLYTGNFIGDVIGKNKTQYGNRHGFCFETQGFPDAIHHANFPSVILDPKNKYDSKTEFIFSLL